MNWKTPNRRMESLKNEKKKEENEDLERIAWAGLLWGAKRRIQWIFSYHHEAFKVPALSSPRICFSQVFFGKFSQIFDLRTVG